MRAFNFSQQGEHYSATRKYDHMCGERGKCTIQALGEEKADHEHTLTALCRARSLLPYYNDFKKSQKA